MQTGDDHSPTTSSPQRNHKMTVIEKSPPLVQSPSPGKSRSGISKSDGRKDSKSPEKSGRRDSDLISTATSALRRLHFRSAGGSRTKRGQTTTSGGQSIPKLMVMGSSTTSETTTNTSTDSSNTVYTMVTVTDAEQDERVDNDLLDTKIGALEEKLKPKETMDTRREVHRRYEKRYETRGSREILNEFDELFLENEKRIRAEEEKNERKSRKGLPRQRLDRRKEEDIRKCEAKEFDRFEDLNVTTVTIEDIQDRRRNTFQQKAKSSESEEERFEKRSDENVPRLPPGSSSERDSDEIFSSTEDQVVLGMGAPPPTPLIQASQKDHSFFSKPSIIDEETMRNLESIVENGTCDYEKPRPDKPKSNVRTIQSELPQLTFRSNFSKKTRKGDQKEARSRGSSKESGKSSPKTKGADEGFFQFSPRSASPKPLSRSASPKFTRSSSTNLKRLVDKSPANVVEEEGRTCEVAALTASNLEKLEKQLSEEMKKSNQSKFESIFNMDSPTTMKSSPPVDGYFDPTKKTGKFEFPSCISPTEINNAFVAEEGESEVVASESVRDKSEQDSPRDDVAGEEETIAAENANKKRKRSDRKSISVETPIKLLQAEEKIAQNRITQEGYRDLIMEDKLASFQNRKYSVLATDGSIKNFVSENNEDFKKTNQSSNKENVKKKSPGTRRGSECPQRHRRVSIIQGDSLRHFIFEEPEPTRKSNRRKMSKMPEDTTKNLLLDNAFTRKSSLVPGDTLRNLLGDEGTRKSSNGPDEKVRKFSINTLGDIVSARKFSLLPPGEIYTSQIDGKTTEIIKLAPGTKGRPLATIVVQQASIQRGSISGPSGQKEDALLDVANTFTLEELHEFDMKYGSPHHCRSQSVKTPGRSCGRPNYLCLPQQRSRVASMPNTGVEEEYYRLRHFSITGKGVVNRGDSLKSRRSRSNNSVASSNSSHSTEHLASNIGTVGSHPGSARTSAECSLASSRESSTASMPYKVVMLGGAGVGKSSLISQFMTSEYLHAYDTSLDEEYGEKSVSVLLDGEESELIFVDHPSAEMSPENCITTYEPQAYIVVYSVVDRSSLQIAEEILQSLWKTDSIASKAVILVGNKTDLVRSRTITTEEGKNMARSYDCKFIETSVGINHNVDELLVGILTQIRLKIQQAMKPKRNKSPLGSCMGKDNESPKKWRNSRLSASLKVKGLLGRVWARDSKSKSFSGEALTSEELDQFKNYTTCWFKAE